MARGQRNKRTRSNPSPEGKVNTWNAEPYNQKAGKPESQTIRTLHFSDRLLEYFLDEIREQLGEHLKQIILFGSRARGDYVADSDYDFLAVVDKVSPEIKEIVDKVAGEFLFQYDTVFSIFPISEEKYRKKTYEPFLRNIRREGISLEPYGST